MNVTFLHQLFPYLPPSDWVSIVRTCKHTAKNSNIIQQQVFSARFHLKAIIPAEAKPDAIYALHKQFALHAAANTWALRTPVSIRFLSPILTHCILLPGPLVAGLSGKTLEIRNQHNTRIDQILFKHNMALLAASRDGKKIAAGSFRNDISVHTLADKQVQKIAKSNLDDLVKTHGKLSLEGLAFFPDGRLFTAYHTQTTGIVVVWNLAAQKRQEPILIERFRLEACQLSPSGRSFTAQGIELVNESPRSFEKDQPLESPKAKVLKVAFWHHNFKTGKHMIIIPPGTVKPKQFAVVSDETFVAAVDSKLAWIPVNGQNGKKIENPDDGYEITNLCLGTNGLLHATTQWTLNQPTLTRNQFRTYDLSTGKRISCLRIHPLSHELSETPRTLFLTAVPGAVAFATAQNGHADLIMFGSATPPAAASSSSSSAAAAAPEVLNLADDSPPLPQDFRLFLSPPTPTPPSVPLASPKALPPNSPPEPPRKKRYQPLPLTAAASSSSSSSAASSAATPPPSKKPMLHLVKK